MFWVKPSRRPVTTWTALNGRTHTLWSRPRRSVCCTPLMRFRLWMPVCVSNRSTAPNGFCPESRLRLRRRAPPLLWHFCRFGARGGAAKPKKVFAAALEQIRAFGDEFEFAQHLVDYSYVQWVSSDYEGARRSIDVALPILLKGQGLVRYMNGQLILAWTLMFRGEWGESLRLLDVAIRTAELNEHQHRAATLRVTGAWVRLHALDFVGALEICEQQLLDYNDAWLWSGPRMCLIVAGCAAANLGYADRALDHLLKAREWMMRQPVNRDWYWHMQLQSGLTDAYLARGDLASARREAQRFLELVGTTAERTWQALAWEANARVALAEGDIASAGEQIRRAIAAQEGVRVPLASWRVHATAADTAVLAGEPEAAARHREVAIAEVNSLAASLEGDPLQQVFLASGSGKSGVEQLLSRSQRGGYSAPGVHGNPH